jgi:hypothetical protein
MRRAMILALAMALLAPAGAEASGERKLAYRFEQAWSAAVRLIRVDYGFPVRDRDEGIGYLLFTYEKGDRDYSGSVELVRLKQERRKRVRVIVKVPEMPSYIERMILDKLDDKLRREFGEPPPPPPKKDDGDDGSGGDSKDDEDEDEDEDDGKGSKDGDDDSEGS